MTPEKIIQSILHEEEVMMERDVGFPSSEDLCVRQLTNCLDCMECWSDKN